MKYKVLGKKIGSFTNQEGELVNYGQLHVSYPDPDVEGTAVEIAKCNPTLITGIKIGDVVTLDRNSRGRVLAVNPAQ